MRIFAFILGILRCYPPVAPGVEEKLYLGMVQQPALWNCEPRVQGGVGKPFFGFPTPPSVPTTPRADSGPLGFSQSPAQHESAPGSPLGLRSVPPTQLCVGAKAARSRFAGAVPRW